MIYYNYSGNFDNEHSNLEYYTDDIGQEYLIHITEGEYCAVWNDGRYIVQITSNLNKDEIIKLCKNTKIK